MATSIVIVIVVIVFAVLIISGHYISSVMFLAGAVGLTFLGGTTALAGFVRMMPYSAGASYTLTTIPLYILMASFIMKAGIINDLYGMIYRISKGKGASLVS